MKRLPLKLAAFVLAGAVTNVALAWGLVLWVGPTSPAGDSNLSGIAAHDLHVHFCRHGLTPSFTDERWTFIVHGRRDESPCITVRSLRRNGLALGHPELVGRGFGGAVVIEAIEISAGWPFTSLSGLRWRDAGGGPWRLAPGPWQYASAVPAPDFLTKVRVPRESWLPLRPVAWGFALNSLGYGVGLWVLASGFVGLWRFTRIRRGLCPNCAYPIGDSPLCTECGQRLRRLHRVR